MRKVLAALAALFITALVAAPAWADSGSYQQAASGLAAEPVYVAPNSGADISRGEVSKLDSQIKKYGIPLYIAILPQSAIADAGGNVDDTPKALGTALGRTAVYGVVAGHNFRATSNGALPSGRTADIANSSFDNNSPADNDGRIYPLLSDFAKNVYYAFHPEAKPKTNWGLIGEVIGIVAGSLVALALVVWGTVTTLRRKREERERAERFAARKSKVEAQYARVLDLVTGLGAPADPAAAEHTANAAAALQRGDTLTGTAKTEDDLNNAASELSTAEHQAGLAKSRIDRRRGLETFVKRTRKRVDALPACDGKADACKQSALTHVSDAEGFLSANDLDGAQRDAERADADAADCEAYCSGRDPVQERENAERERQRVAAEAAERRRREAEERAAEEKRRQKLAARVKPSNFKPVKSRSATHEHRFGGGYYGGVYYAPGYYTDPFWTWVAMDAALSSSHTFEHGSSYDDNYRELHPPSYESSSSSSSSSSYSGYDSSSGGGSWDSGSSGGGSFDSSSGGGSW